MNEKFFRILLFVVLILFFCTNLYSQTSEDLQEFLAEGQAAYKKGELSLALIEFENALLVDPDNFTAITFLIQIYTEMKDVEKATLMLNKTSALQPQNEKLNQLTSKLTSLNTEPKDLQKKEQPIPAKDKPPQKTFEPEILNEGPTLTGLTVTRPLGIVIPPSKLVSLEKELPPISFEDIEIEREKPSKDDFLPVKQDSPLKEVFIKLESEGLAVALDLYFEMIHKNSALAAESDGGLLARGLAHYNKRLLSEPDDIDSNFYAGMINYINGFNSEAYKQLLHFENNYGEREELLKPVIASLKSWKKADDEKLIAREKFNQEKRAYEIAKAQREELKEQQEAAKRRAATNKAETTEEDAYLQAQELHDKGYDFYKRGNLNQAIEKFQEAIELDAENILFHYHLGIAWTDKGLAGDTNAFDNAITSFQFVISIAPDSMEAAESQAMIVDIQSAKELMGE